MAKFRYLLIAAVVVLVFGVMVAVRAVRVGAAESHYQLVEGWAQFPPGFAKWSPVSGVDVDAHDNVYVFQRSEAMPIMVFDHNGRFLRTFGQGVFKQPHFLRVDPAGDIWVTDRQNIQAYKFSSEGKLLMTLGKKGVFGDNTSQD